MADPIAYSIGSMTEAAALADTDMMEIERPEAVEPNSWWRVTALKISAYVLGKLVQGSGMQFTTSGGQLTLESGGANVVDITGASVTLGLANMNRFNRCTSATAQSITIPAQATVAWPDNIQLEGAQFGAGAVTFLGASGVTIRRNSKLTATTDGQYAVWGLKRVGLNDWLLFGQMGAA